jgi:phytoene dehydrogenase-like protein
MNGTHETIDAAVVGAGLAGLAAATYLARADRAVVVLERSSHAGGRAITNDLGGYKRNLGPHALYRKGAAAAVLDELGVPYQGKVPPLNGLAVHNGVLEPISSSPVWFLVTRLLSPGAKLEAVRLLLGVRRLQPEAVRGLSVAEWLEREARHDSVRTLLGALVRVATYAADHERLSADVAVTQLQLAQRGVLYLDGGWQTLVDGLRAAAEAAGARIETGAPVTRVESDVAGCTVHLQGGRALRAASAIVATEPPVAARLIDSPALREAASAAVPVRAACLDAGLASLPEPRQTFALGLDEPTYLSVHSRTAKLAPEGGATIHVAKYLPTEERAGDERELEGLLDLTQPGWRDAVAQRRFLPTMNVVQAMPTAPRGLAGRPGLAIDGAPNVYVAGDWVGPEGWLADAALASARRAAELALEAPRAAVGAPTTAG